MSKRTVLAMTTLAAVTAVALLSGCQSAAAPKIAAAPVAVQPEPVVASSPEASPSAAGSVSPAATPKKSATKPATTKSSLRLGPTGLGQVKLGQSLHDALATGAVTPIAGADDACLVRGRFKATPPADPDSLADDAGLIFAGSLGVTAIYAYAGVSTPEGIHLGSSYADMKKAYPSWHSVYGADDNPDGRGLVSVPGNAGAVYRIATHGGVVISLAIQFQHQNCYE
jgi:hypothetical protein